MNKETIKNPINKVKSICTAASVSTVTLATSNLASATTVDPETVVVEIISIIFDIFRWIGILLLVWSVGMLVLAFKNEDADSKSRAMMLLVVSIALIGLKSLFKTLGPKLGVKGATWK